MDEFSQFARLPEIRLEQGRLNDVIRQTVALYEDRLQDTQILTDLDPDLPQLMLDAEQTKRVFVNLIDNALEAFPARSDVNRIEISTRHDSIRDVVIAEVADNAAGLQPGVMQKLFQPYFSTKNRGTGLGLAIVQRIVTDHGARIFARANQPRGARFIIEFPTAP